MAINADKPQRWKADIARSVAFHDDWYLRFAPSAYRYARQQARKDVEAALDLTAHLAEITPTVLMRNPWVLPILRMATAPPIARERLIRLAGVSPNLVRSMEVSQQLPSRMSEASNQAELQKVVDVIWRLVDTNLFPWLRTGGKPARRFQHPSYDHETPHVAMIVADRIAGRHTESIIHEAQERRQHRAIGEWLGDRGYASIENGRGLNLDDISPGSCAFGVDIPGVRHDGSEIDVLVDAAVMPRGSQPGELPLFIEAISSRDSTDTNRKAKEEAQKLGRLRSSYGADVRCVLFLCGYFDSGYLSHQASEGIDWVWEHRLEEMAELGL